MQSRDVSQDEREQLSELSRAGGRSAQRAQSVLLLSEGLSVRDVARRVGLTAPTIDKWDKRFDALGPAGLHDRARSGQPRRLDADRRGEIARVTQDELPVGEPRWTLRGLARRLAVTEHQVRSVWSERQLAAPKLAQPVALGPICGLFMAPPLCIVVATQPGMPYATTRTMRGGSSLRAVHRQIGNAIDLSARVECAASLLVFLSVLRERRPDTRPLLVLGSSASLFSAPGLAYGVLGRGGFVLRHMPRVDLWIDFVEHVVREQGHAKDSEAVASLRAAVIRYLEAGKSHPFAWLHGHDRAVDLRAIPVEGGGHA